VLPAHVADTVGGVGCRRAFVLRVARVHAPPADRPGTPPFGAPDERHRARLSSSRVDDGRWLDHPTALPMPFTQVIPDPHVQSPLARGGQIVVPAPGPASRGRPRVCRSSRSALSARSGCSPFGGIAPPPMPGRGRRPSPAATAATAAAAARDCQVVISAPSDPRFGSRRGSARLEVPRQGRVRRQRGRWKLIRRHRPGARRRSRGEGDVLPTWRSRGWRAAHGRESRPGQASRLRAGIPGNCAGTERTAGGGGSGGPRRGGGDAPSQASPVEEAGPGSGGDVIDAPSDVL